MTEGLYNRIPAWYQLHYELCDRNTGFRPFTLISNLEDVWPSQRKQKLIAFVGINPATCWEKLTEDEYRQRLEGSSGSRSEGRMGRIYNNPNINAAYIRFNVYPYPTKKVKLLNPLLKDEVLKRQGQTTCIEINKLFKPDILIIHGADALEEIKSEGFRGLNSNTQFAFLEEKRIKQLPENVCKELYIEPAELLNGSPTVIVSPHFSRCPNLTLDNLILELTKRTLND